MRAEAVCAYPKELKGIAARISTLTPPRYWACSFKRRICQVVPPVDGLWSPQIHCNCVCNELVSLHNRHLMEVPEPTKLGLVQLRKNMRRITRVLDYVEPISPVEFISHYSGAKRTRYENAWNSLLATPLCAKDSYVDAFIKAEKFSPYDKANPDPRMIQSRSPRYTMFVGRYMRPMFSQFKRIEDPTKTRMIVKGMNMPDRAALFKEKWDRFKCPVAFSLDGSRFDAHLHQSVLALADGVYHRLAASVEFSNALNMRRVTRGKTMNGVKFRCKGRRCSGDFDTGDGNSLLMADMIWSAMCMIGVHKWAAMADGDDAVLIVEKEFLSLVAREIGPVFLHFGQEVKLENIAYRMCDVRMCRARMYECEPGKWSLVRDWQRVLSHESSGFRHWDQPTVMRSIMATVGLCDLALHRGIPVLQEHALAMMRIGGDVYRPDLLECDESIHRFGRELGREPLVAAARYGPRPITQFARSSFERTFGLSASQQIALEGLLAHWELTSVNPIECQRQWDWRWTDLTPPELVVRC